MGTPLLNDIFAECATLRACRPVILDPITLKDDLPSAYAQLEIYGSTCDHRVQFYLIWRPVMSFRQLSVE
jgi:hypothetical protein